MQINEGFILNGLCFNMNLKGSLSNTWLLPMVTIESLGDEN